MGQGRKNRESFERLKKADGERPKRRGEDPREAESSQSESRACKQAIKEGDEHPKAALEVVIQQQSSHSAYTAIFQALAMFGRLGVRTRRHAITQELSLSRKFSEALPSTGSTVNSRCPPYRAISRNRVRCLRSQPP